MTLRDPMPPVPSELEEGDLLWQGEVKASRQAFAPPYELPEDPHRGLGLLRMALWVLVLIPLHETARRLLRRKDRP